MSESGLAQCSRCGRLEDIRSGGYLEWESLGEGRGEICPGCLTGAEQQAIDETDTATEVAAQDLALRESDADAYRLRQADALLREAGFRKRPDGTWHGPGDN